MSIFKNKRKIKVIVKFSKLGTKTSILGSIKDEMHKGVKYFQTKIA